MLFATQILLTGVPNVPWKENIVKMRTEASYTSDIDFVITWVDGNDTEWQREKAAYKGEEEFNRNNVRYRDWDILRYWFRAVEQYAPWVRRIYFVTCGQKPEWLNTSHPKLHMVKHSDYMKQEYLPTFSSHPIELNLHRIKGLSEKFVYFNDDMFLNDSVLPEDFFKNGLPCDSAVLSPVKIERFGIANIVVNDLCIINDHFDFRSNFRRDMRKWITLGNRFQTLRTLLLLPWNYYVGFYEQHIAYAYLKSTFEKVWAIEGKVLDEVCTHRFRDGRDVNQWLMRYWQLAEGNFTPRNIRTGRLFFVNESVEEICQELGKHRHKIICINDSEKMQNFDEAKRMVQLAYEREYPHKSGFEV